jgi:hypothetical protein
MTGAGGGLIWTFALAIVVMSLFLLTLLPALIEHRWPKDIAPLRVVREFDNNVANFAHGFGTFVDNEFGQVLLTLGANETYEGKLKSGEDYLLLGKTAELPMSSDDGTKYNVRKIVAGAETVKIPHDILFSKEVYAGGDFFCGRYSACRAVLSEGRAELERDCTILRWIHTKGELHAAQGVQLFGRASSDTSLHLAEGVVFERLHAPKIEFGEITEDIDLGAQASLPLIDWQPEQENEMLGDRWRINGDVVIPVGSRCTAPIVVLSGLLIVGAASSIERAIKCNGNLILGEACCCDDAVVATERLEVGAGCLVQGPLISETIVLLRSGCIIGTADAPTTITAPQILIEPGVIVYGTVWARERGEVGFQP